MKMESRSRAAFCFRARLLFFGRSLCLTRCIIRRPGYVRQGSNRDMNRFPGLGRSAVKVRHHSAISPRMHLVVRRDFPAFRQHNAVARIARSGGWIPAKGSRRGFFASGQERAVQHHGNSLPFDDKVAVVRLDAVHEAATSEVAARHRSGS